MAEETVMIPQFVLDALALVRASGITNMMDREAVIFLCEMDGNLRAATWLQRASSTQYLAALALMGQQVHAQWEAEHGGLY